MYDIRNLIQANAELHNELDRKVKINLENESKIKDLKCHQIQYEKYIEHLEKKIENLQASEELQDLKSRFLDVSNQLKKCNELCNEKEQYILFLEVQILELRDKQESDTLQQIVIWQVPQVHQLHLPHWLREIVSNYIN